MTPAAVLLLALNKAVLSLLFTQLRVLDMTIVNSEKSILPFAGLPW